jgi:uncharacterized membrane protein YfcA
MELLEVSFVSFVLSFVFALGGLGSAVLLIPVLTFLGIPFELARPTGLFTNVLSTTSGLIHNIKHKLVDWKLAIPLAVSATAVAPIGAYLSHIIPAKVIGVLFTFFLIYAGVMLYIPKKGHLKYENEFPIFIPIAVGGFAGLLSGLLGVGGGSIASPTLIVLGFDPKKVIGSVIVMVPFSSFAGFLTYWKLGSVDWNITLAAAIPAALAGYLGAAIAHRYLNTAQVKKILGILFFVIAIKFLLKWF